MEDNIIAFDIVIIVIIIGVCITMTLNDVRYTPFRHNTTQNCHWQMLENYSMYTNRKQ